MMSRLAHRGPDGSGLYIDDTVSLGHTRLAIIDPAGGVQPMGTPDGMVWLTFNGEIFNYVELAAQLADRGHRFRTHSDTEVVLHAWLEWGTDCFERLNGQWALGLWDRRARSLILSRDRLGERPLFITRANGSLLFASEIKSLFADDRVRRALDPAGLAQALSLWSPVAPVTAFADVEQVPPGCYVRVSTAGVDCHSYWEADFQVTRPDVPRRALVDELRERLVEATRLRFLRSDVPVGAYLSGGVDSAIIAALVAEFTDAPLRTFSLRFEDGEFDESPYQHLVAERLGTRHAEIVVGAADIAAAFPEVVRHAEVPLLRSAPAPMFLLSGLVRDEGVKVVVTGEGADEVLAGYDLFRETKVRSFLSRDPDSDLRGRAVELLYPWLRRSPNRAPAFARAFFGRNLDPADPGFSHRPRWDAGAALVAMLTTECRSALPPEASTLAALPAASLDWDELALAQWLEMRTLLPGYLLSSQGDRMLMAHSVEGRFPFLDPDLVGFANSVPSFQKMPALREKHLLKLAFGDLVPPEVVLRPKQPYRSPDAASFFAAGEVDWLPDVLSGDAIRSAGIFEPRVVQRLVQKCRERDGRGIGNTDNMRVLAVLSLQLLHRQFVQDGGGDASASAPPAPMKVFGDAGQEES